MRRADASSDRIDLHRVVPLGPHTRRAPLTAPRRRWPSLRALAIRSRTSQGEAGSAPAPQWQLAAALRGCRVDVFGDVRQGSTSIAWALSFSDAHLVLIQVTDGEEEVADAVSSLTSLNWAGELLGPPVDLFATHPRVLRVVATADSRQPTRVDGVPVVGASALAERLRGALDTDEVWLALAALDRHEMGWIGAGLAPSVVQAEGWASTVHTPERLSAVNATLRSAGLSPTWAWPSCRDIDDMYELIDPEGPLYAAVSPVSGHLVVTNLAPTPVHDREMQVQLVQAVLRDLDALTRARPAPWVVKRILRRPLALSINFVFPTPEHEDQDAIGVDVAGDDRWVALEIHTSPLHVAGGWPHTRSLLAGAIAHHRIRTRSRWSRRIAARLRHQFAKAWLAAPSSLVVGWDSTEPASIANDDVPGPDTTQLENAFLNDAADMDPGIRVKTYTGTQARQMLNQSLVPHVLAKLVQLQAPVGGRHALGCAMGALQHAMAAQLNAHARLPFDLGGPWQREHFGYHLVRSSQVLMSSRAADVLVEATVLGDIERPGRCADRIDEALWLACASTALRLALTSQSDFAGLRSAELTVGPEGVAIQEYPTELDIAQFMQAAQMVMAARSRTNGAAPGDDHPAQPAPPVPPGGKAAVESAELPFLPLQDDDAPPEFVAVQTAMRRGLGTDMAGIVAVLASAASLPLTFDQPIRRVKRAAFIDDVATWANLPHTEIEAACALLTLRTGGDRGDLSHFWKLEARVNRLATRPLILHDDELWVSPARCRGTQRLFANYLSEGRLPWPRAALQPQVRDSLVSAAAKMRQERNRTVEKEVHARVVKAGWPARAQVRPTHKGLPWLPGEVDVLTADLNGMVVWVLEVKDLQTAFSPVEIGEQVGAIHGPRWPHGSPNSKKRDQVQALTAKADAVRANLAETLRFLNVNGDGQVPGEGADWTVRQAIVSPGPLAAAFMKSSGCPFLLTDQVPEVLRALPSSATGFAWALPSWLIE